VRKESDLNVEEKTLKREIEILIKLQAVDLELYQSERFHQKYPEKLKKLEKKIEEEQVRFQQTKERLEGLQKERKQKEKDLEIEAERVKKAEEKLASVKTNKEYQAAVKEIETLKQINSAKEDEILLVMEEIDTLQDEQKKKEKELGEKMKAFQEEKKKLEEEEQKFGAVSEENKVLREDLVRELEINLLRQYMIIKEKRNGLAVVSVKKGTCSGCSMHIPPQLYNDILTNEHIITCPSCNRILYVQNGGKTVDKVQSEVDTVGTSGV
jgi:hypothetical protein